MAVPPVDMLPVSASWTRVPLGGTSSGPKPCLAASSRAMSFSAMRVKHLLVADATARVGVLDVDQLAQRVVTVGVDAGRHALGDGGHLAVDDQHAVVVAVDVGLDDQVAVAALSAGERHGAPDVVVCAQVEVDAATVVAIERLDHDREAERLGGGDRLVFAAHASASAGRAGRPSSAGCWSGSCRTRCRLPAPASARSSSPGSGAGGCPGRAGQG